MNKHNPNYISIELVQIGTGSFMKLAELTQGEAGVRGRVLLMAILDPLESRAANSSLLRLYVNRTW